MTLTPEAKQESDTPRDRNLDGCEAFIAAMLQRDLPPSFKALSDTPEIWPNNWGQDVAMAAFMVHKDAERISDLESQLATVTAERDALQNALLRNGFTQCDIAACNCGSWHHRYGLPERWEEIKDTLREADVLDNSVGNLPLNAIKRLVTERDARQESNRQESAAMALLLERECQDGDKLAEALGVPRTEGGSLQVQRMLNVIDALRVDAERYKIARSWGVNVYRRGGERAKPNE